jgi:hypothetical protein
MQGGDDEVDIVAELVSTIMPSYLFKYNDVHTISSPKAHPEQGVTIPKVSKVVC